MGAAQVGLEGQAVSPQPGEGMGTCAFALPLGVSHWGGPCIQEMEAMHALKLRNLFKIPLVRHGHVLSYQ